MPAFARFLQCIILTNFYNLFYCLMYFQFYAPPLYIQWHIDFLDTMFFVHTIFSVVVTPYITCLITLQGLVIVVLSIWHHYCCVCVFVFNHITILIGFFHTFSFVRMFQTSFLL